MHRALCDHSGRGFRVIRQMLILINIVTAGGFPGIRMVGKNAGLMTLNVIRKISTDFSKNLMEGIKLIPDKVLKALC